MCTCTYNILTLIFLRKGLHCLCCVLSALSSAPCSPSLGLWLRPGASLGPLCYGAEGTDCPWRGASGGRAPSFQEGLGLGSCRQHVPQNARSPGTGLPGGSWSCGFGDALKISGPFSRGPPVSLVLVSSVTLLCLVSGSSEQPHPEDSSGVFQT